MPEPCSPAEPTVAHIPQTVLRFDDLGLWTWCFLTKVTINHQWQHCYPFSLLGHLITKVTQPTGGLPHDLHTYRHENTCTLQSFKLHISVSRPSLHQARAHLLRKAVCAVRGTRSLTSHSCSLAEQDSLSPSVSVSESSPRLITQAYGQGSCGGSVT